MKKILAVLLALTMVLALAACGGSDKTPATEAATEAPTEAATEAATEAPTEAETEAETEAAAEVPVMTHEEYISAEVDTPVCVETYVQATQEWYKDAITVYAQSEDGAYFIYNMACAEADASKLVPGAKIKVTGFKGEWSGEVEIVDATFELMEGEFVAEPEDVTDLLGTDELINHQNELIACKGLTVVSITYKNDEPGDDIYVSLTKDDVALEFCVERYLCDPDTDVYKAVGELKEGDVIDLTGFLYWYEGPNTHITSVTVQ